MNVFRQVLLWLGLSGAVAQAAAWPMFRGGPALLGVAEGTLPARLELLWSFKTAGPVKSSAAIDQGRVFLPRNLPEGPTADAPALEPLLDQPARSLREMQDGMSAGLEPVASSARRAVDLFLRELPGSDRSNKRGS